MSTDPQIIYLANLAALKPVFEQRLNHAGKDFTAISGYQYCAKAVSAMGLLAALGDTHAAAIAKKALLTAALPFGQPPAAPESLREIVLDVNRPYAQRIYSLNLLKESNSTFVPPSRGDPIYLETGALGLCLGIGYDWLYEALSPDERAIVESAIKEVLLWSNNIDNEFFTAAAPAAQRESNWNAVMSGGSGILGIAALDSSSGFSCVSLLSPKLDARQRRTSTIDRLGKERICQAIVALRYYWKTYTDSGAYIEGPLYWFYGMESYALFVDTLEKFLGRRDFSVSYDTNRFKRAEVQADLIHENDGFWLGSRSAISKVSAYTFADSAASLVPASFPLIFSTDYATNTPAKELAVGLLHQQIMNEIVHSPTAWASYSNDWSRVFSLIARRPLIPSAQPKRRLVSYSSADHRFDLIKLSSSAPGGDWVVHQKGGSFNQPHAHLDSGSFILRIGGENWISDLGYERPASGGYPTGYFVLPARSEYTNGLRFFRKNDLSHSIVTLASRPINLSGRATIVSTLEGVNPADGAPYAQVVWDTTSLYTPDALSASRVLTLTQRGKYTTFDVVDRLDFPSSVGTSSNTPLAVWRAVTCAPNPAEASVVVDESRVLKISHGASNTLTMQVVRPTGATPQTSIADPNTNSRIKRSSAGETENSNPGCHIIEVPGNASQLISTAGNLRRLTYSIRFQKQS